MGKKQILQNKEKKRGKDVIFDGTILMKVAVWLSDFKVPITGHKKWR
jgi:hypothetical protein